MKIKVETHLEGFSVTIEKGTHDEKKFNCLDPAIKHKMIAIKQNIQAILSDVCGVPNLMRNSRTRLVDATSALLTTPERALAALEVCRDRDFLKHDFGPDIATFVKGPQYQSLLQVAVKAGVHPRKPNASVGVHVYLRPEDDAFVFGTWPQDIIQNIGLTREIPHDVQPVYSAAEIITDYEENCYDILEGKGNQAQRKILEKAKAVLTDDLDKVIRGLHPETDDGKNSLTNFETALRADIEVVQKVIDMQAWHLRTYVEQLVKPDTFMTRCGFAGFAERLLGSQTTPMSVNRNDKNIDVDIDSI